MEELQVDNKLLKIILDSREARAEKQREILKNFPYTLISFTLNIPGAKKNSDLYSKIHGVGMEAILKSLYDSNNRIYYIKTYNKLQTFVRQKTKKNTLVKNLISEGRQ